MVIRGFFVVKFITVLSDRFVILGIEGREVIDLGDTNEIGMVFPLLLCLMSEGIVLGEGGGVICRKSFVSDGDVGISTSVSVELDDRLEFFSEELVNSKEGLADGMHLERGLIKLESTFFSNCSNLFSSLILISMLFEAQF